MNNIWEGSRSVLRAAVGGRRRRQRQRAATAIGGAVRTAAACCGLWRGEVGKDGGEEEQRVGLQARVQNSTGERGRALRQRWGGGVALP